MFKVPDNADSLDPLVDWLDVFAPVSEVSEVLVPGGLVSLGKGPGEMLLFFPWDCL